ncbi:hypothetical protein OJAV_G00108700 [Oryzias javanicus]|uniref:Uncharacterized protein n=1 Tax=Oryzias javanicus TaxID=123683 RepID=A0A437CUE4_ORYJA|nr:hypothetical protein OJAV_G00108700 [Oryzias javanicus]
MVLQPDPRPVPRRCRTAAAGARVWTGASGLQAAGLTGCCGSPPAVEPVASECCSPVGRRLPAGSGATEQNRRPLNPGFWHDYTSSTRS